MYQPENYIETLPPLFNAHLTECRKERHVIVNNISATHPNFILGIQEQKEFVEDMINRKFKSLSADDDAGLLDQVLAQRYYRLFSDFIRNPEFKSAGTLQLGIIAFRSMKKQKQNGLQKKMGQSSLTCAVIGQTQQSIEEGSPRGEHSTKRRKPKSNK